MSDVNVKHTIP